MTACRQWLDEPLDERGGGVRAARAVARVLDVAFRVVELGCVLRPRHAAAAREAHTANMDYHPAGWPC